MPINTSLGNEMHNAKNPNSDIYKFMRDNDAMAIFTDGGKYPGSFSVVTACICHNHSINPNASNFTAECLALNGAIDIAFQNSQKKYMFSLFLSVLLLV